MARKPSSPAFQFYPNEWLANTTISLMTPDQEGAYIRLMCHAWNDPECSIPDDDEQLSKLSRLGEGWFTNGSLLVRRCFKQNGTRLVHEGLLAYRKKQREWSEKSHLGGVRSGRARRCAKAAASNGGSLLVEPNGNVSPSPSIKNTTSVVRGKKFIKPSLDEVKAYCAERKNNIDPAHFWNYYEANGWRTSNGPMKDWHAAVCYWESNGHQRNGQTQKSIPQLETMKR